MILLLALLLAGGTNLLTNGGCDEWTTGTTRTRPADLPKLPHGTPAGWSARQEAYERGERPEFEIQATVARDDQVKHGGAASARFTNALTTDIGELGQGPLAVEANSLYRVRVWVKGDAIVPNGKDGCGVIVWANQGPRGESLARSPQVKSGTFDWQLCEFEVETAAECQTLTVKLQLRRASGTAWFDDAELVRLGSVRRVESY